MRKVTFGGASSLDNFFARKNHSVDWLMWSDEAGEIMQTFWTNVDTIIMGRKTFDIAMKNVPKGKDGANPYGDIKTYVFSRKLKKGAHKGAEIVNGSPGRFVRNLKEKQGGEICVMGGGDLARSLFEAGVIDEIGFNIHPTLLGKGIPLFYEMKRQIDLELLECRPFKNGCVYVLYKVKN